MTDVQDSPASDENDAPSTPAKAIAAKAKPVKVLPTDRLIFEKQLSVIRAYAAASGPDKQATTNNDVGSVAEISPGTISLCNPFLIDCGLLVREGMKQRPTEVVFDYHAAWGWNQQTAAEKLYPAFANTWFAKVLTPRLSFRSLSVEEAVALLAQEAKASKDYKDQLLLLLSYLDVAGVINLKDNIVSKPNSRREFEAPAPEAPTAAPKIAPEAPREDVHTFSLPLPQRASAIITVPTNFDADDWEMLNEMMATYIKRWKKFETKKNGG